MNKWLSGYGRRKGGERENKSSWLNFKAGESGVLYRLIVVCPQNKLKAGTLQHLFVSNRTSREQQFLIAFCSLPQCTSEKNPRNTKETIIIKKKDGMLVHSQKCHILLRLVASNLTAHNCRELKWFQNDYTTDR